jgi:protein ImuB
MSHKPEPLWLALSFPRLALDIATRGHGPRGELPVAITENDTRRQQVVDCTPAAARAGVRPGMPASAALGLLETLRILPRDPLAERDALQGLAAWCYQYSSLVSIDGQRGALLLEAGASRLLFGAADELARKLCGGLQRLGYHAQAGTAPTPEAARLAALHGLHIDRAAEIRARLEKLPLDSLYLPHARSLREMGFRTIGEILRLPRKALARRLGPAAADHLDRLLGSKPDPQKPWRPALHFSSGMDFAAGTGNSQALLFPLKRMVAELCGVLRACDRGIQELRIRLRLDSRGSGSSEECLWLGLQQPMRSEAHILLLLRERLERLRLSDPVRHVRLEAGRLLPFDAQQGTLFRDDPGLAEQAMHPLLERLHARLGADAVHGLKGVQDHRPEHSWSVRELGEAADCRAMPHRPVWLFARPQRCRIGDYQVLAGPERIETGWWDGHDCRRDYFVVRDRHGSTLWAFHEYKPEPGWYLQGSFG